MCAQRKTHTGLGTADGKWEVSDTTYKSGSKSGKFFREYPSNSDRVLGMATYIERYASAPDSPMTDAPEVHAHNLEVEAYASHAWLHTDSSCLRSRRRRTQLEQLGETSAENDLRAVQNTRV